MSENPSTDTLMEQRRARRIKEMEGIEADDTRNRINGLWNNKVGVGGSQLVRERAQVKRMKSSARERDAWPNTWLVHGGAPCAESQMEGSTGVEDSTVSIKLTTEFEGGPTSLCLFNNLEISAESHLPRSADLLKDPERAQSFG